MGPVTEFVFGQVAGKVFDWAVFSPIGAVMEKRSRLAQEVLLEEVREGKTFTSQEKLEDAAAMALRYARAAEEGAARRNLRLMARLLAGALEDEGLYASEFLRWAPTLASLSREELAVAVEFHRALAAKRAEGVARENAPGAAMPEAIARLVGPGLLFAEEAEVFQVIGQLVGSGLLIFGSAFGGIVYYASPRMDDLVRLARLETWDFAD